jgi:D-apionolactonase
MPNNREEAEMINLSAGPLSLGFLDGDLRRISLGAREVLQRVYVAVRDRKWTTLPNQISRLDIQQEESGFRITWNARNLSPEIDFEWTALITGQSDGSVSFSFYGFARRDFLRNRIGFCILHPQTCAGRHCRFVTSTAQGEGNFPELISPHQPFKDLSSFSHEIEPGVWARIDFEGDRFEMEDQRNWTDASFKTYSTPLDLPFPVAVREGERIRQKVTISLRDADDRPLAVDHGYAGRVWPAGHSTGPVPVKIGGSSGRVLCSLGFGVGDSVVEDESALELAARLAPSHLRTEIHLDRGGWALSLEHGAQIARAVGAPLWCLVTSTERRLPAEFVQALAQCPSPPQALLVTRSAPPWTTEAVTIESLRADCARLNYHPRIGGGTDAWFAQLNRTRPETRAFDFVFYSATPQVHAQDSLSIIENLPGLSATVASAKAISGGKPVVVSPLTLKPRFIPSFWEGAIDDSRQREKFGAVWSLMAIKHLSQEGAVAATFFELEGPQGLFSRDANAPHGTPLPYPVYYVFRELSAWTEAELLEVESGDPRRIDTFALKRGPRSVLFLCNMTDETQEALVEGMTIEVSHLRWLAPEQDATSMPRGRLILPPYSIAIAEEIVL